MEICRWGKPNIVYSDSFITVSSHIVICHYHSTEKPAKRTKRDKYSLRCSNRGFLLWGILLPCAAVSVLPSESGGAVRTALGAGRKYKKDKLHNRFMYNVIFFANVLQ